MSCPSCGSANDAKFAAEIILHFHGFENVNKPGVWLFPKLLVCLDCGFSRFTVPKTELLSLAAPTSPSDNRTPHPGSGVAGELTNTRFSLPCSSELLAARCNRPPRR